jgi:hypothetical protein
MTLPNLFVIGAAKAGTTSLHYYLDQHPQVQMSTVKEPNFFSGPPNGNNYPLGRVETLAEYERLFDDRFQVRGEASVGYSNYPRRQGVPAAIKELVRQPKFVYMVRDPVTRIVSQYQYRVAMEGERRPIEEALADLTDPYSVYLCPSQYATQLELYLREFPEDDILVVDQGDLLHDRRPTLSRIFDFLEVDSDQDLAAFDEQLNTGDEKRSFSIGYVRFRERLKASPLRLLPPGLRRSLRRRLEQTFWSPLPPTQLSDDLRGRLEERFAPEASRLRELTGARFPDWSV